ncbi:MAG TPA: hypothetical protein DCQ15_10095 [Chitinophagaceae bacterium]|nr:hypothetical protein [Chitinophagaceae bacterium]
MQEKISNWASILPNPVKDKLTVQVFSNEKSAGKIIISNAAGQILLQKNDVQFLPGLQNIKLPVVQLPQGLYFVKIIKGAGSKVCKLLKADF